MKNLNLNLYFTETGSPFIHTYQAVVMNKETKEVNNLLTFSNKEDALKEAEIYKDLGYTFLYLNQDIVFLR